MAITYDPAAGQNKIKVVGFAPGVPATFQDIYNADKAGTLSLHARAGIVAVDGAGVAVDRALRPAGYVILGGASGDLYIAVTNWNLMTNATIRVIGTDRDGLAQTDDVVVNANGNFNTVKWFKTVTHTQVTVFNTPGGGSFDYDLTQGQWGVVWKQGRQYMFDAKLVIGNHVPTTYFADQRQQVLFDKVATANGQAILFICSNTSFELGTVDDAAKKITSGGIHWMVDEDTFSRTRYTPGFPAGLVANMYSTAIMQTDQKVDWEGYWGNLWNFMADNIVEELEGTADLFNFTLIGPFSAPHTGITIEKMQVLDSVTVGASACLNIFYPVAIKDLFIRSSSATHRVMMVNQNANHSYLVDADLDVWNVYFAPWMASNKKLFRQYTFNLKVVDADGAGINSVNAVMTDKNGAIVFNANTAGTGDIVEQTVTYGTYEDDGLGGLFVGFSPHTLTLTKPGYASRTIVYTMDRKREEIEKLGGAAPHGMEYRRRRVPGEVSALVEQ